MGYRTYLGFMSNEEYETLSNFKDVESLLKYIGEIKEGDEYDKDIHFLYLGDILKNKIQICNEFIPSEKDEGCEPFFKDIDLRGDDFCLIDETVLLKIINVCEDRIKSYHKDLIQPFLDENNFIKLDSLNNTLNNEIIEALYELITNFHRQCLEIGSINLFNGREGSVLNIEKGDLWVSNGNLYVFEIFNLVNLYKNFDWDKNKMIFAGW